MLIDSKTLIAGQPALKIRGFFKKMSSFDFFWELAVEKYFGLSPSQSKKLLKELVKLGFIKKTNEPNYKEEIWEFTTKGLAFSIASAGKAIKREKAEELLNDFLIRVGLVNINPNYMMKVSKVVVFGSFLTNTKALGDVDLAIDLKIKETDIDKINKFRERKIKEASDAGRRFSSYLDALSWPEKEVWQVLKSKKRGLSLHAYKLHEDFLKKEPHKILYQE